MRRRWIRTINLGYSGLCGSCSLIMEACARNSDISQDAVIPMAQQQESVIILLKHCEEMKRQESRLRMCTFIVVIGFVAVYLSMQHVTHASGEKATFKPASSIQKFTECQGKDLKDPKERKPYVHVTTQSPCSNNAKSKEFLLLEHYLGTVFMNGFTYDKRNGSLIVPQAGKYFVYVGMNFRMPSENVDSYIHIKVQKYSDSYKTYVDVMDVIDEMDAKSTDTRGQKRTVYTGRILELINGDHLRVWVENVTYRLIDCQTEGNYFGAFFL